ncbi:Oidioi.mRNA.OKI2018_I69.YSR.g17121.t1.cds [Oikopleura dioica]|uniref:Oidioi.mRNA.OKI2018_I69.YSR.g17121.t1.cds n=1 Tax=Oikopleura dioica TaxID=34765 RepID=A0ABN7SI84_OIKDI|nr:Oidioi.mRNA.OKI2018_I69.YSR.g17121.t1.cds [Oikopleura dioica]
MSKKRKLSPNDRLELIPPGAYPDLDAIITDITEVKHWQSHLEFKKVIQEEQWNGQIVCSGPCSSDNAPILAWYPESKSLKLYNVVRHINSCHNPERRDERRRVTPGQLGIANFVKRPKLHDKSEKIEAAKHFAKVGAKCQVPIKFLESESLKELLQFYYEKGSEAGATSKESFNSLVPSAYYAKKEYEKSSEEMEQFLREHIPELLETNHVSAETDDKHLGQKTSDFEDKAHGTLLSATDPDTRKRKSYLVGYDPTESQSSDVLIDMTTEALLKIGVPEHKVSLIPFVADAAEDCVVSTISHLGVICYAHTFNRAGQQLQEYSEEFFGMEPTTHESFANFLLFQKKRLTPEAARRLKLSPEAPRSLRDFFWKETMTDSDKKKWRELDPKSNRETFPLIPSTNGIRWNLLSEQYKVVYFWKEKLIELSKPDHKFHYLLDGCELPSWGYVESFARVATLLLEFIRACESTSAALPDGFPLLERLMIKLSTMTEGITDADTKAHMAKLSKAAFSKISNMFFESFVKNGEKFSRNDPCRSTEANLVANLLYPPCKKVRFSNLVNHLLSSQDVFYKENGKNIAKAVLKWERHAVSACEELYKLMEPDDSQNEPLLRDSQRANHVDDFDIVEEANELDITQGIEKEIKKYQTTVSRDDFYRPSEGKVTEEHMHFASISMRNFWTDPGIISRFPRLAKVATKVLSCPLSSSEIEREFSSLSGYTANPKRNRIKIVTTKKLRQYVTAAEFKKVCLKILQTNAKNTNVEDQVL